MAATAEDPHDAAAAWAQLHGHQTDLATGDCVICHLPGPCRIANDAAAFLAVRGIAVEDDQPTPADRRLRRLALIARFRRHTQRQRGGR